MFALDQNQKSIGTRYTSTVAFLVVAFIFSPAVLLVSRPFGYVSASLAIGCSALCATLAGFSWKNSRLTIPSIAVPAGVTTY